MKLFFLVYQTSSLHSDERLFLSMSSLSLLFLCLREATEIATFRRNIDTCVTCLTQLWQKSGKHDTLCQDTLHNIYTTIIESRDSLASGTCLGNVLDHVSVDVLCQTATSLSPNEIIKSVSSLLTWLGKTQSNNDFCRN